MRAGVLDRTSSPFFERNAVDAGTTPGQGLFPQSYCISSIHGGQMEEIESRQEQRPRSAIAAESWWKLQADRVADVSDEWE